MTSLRRWLTGCGILLLLLPAVGWAHQSLLSSDPPANAEVSEAPRELRLAFTEPVRLPLTTVSMRGPGGESVDLAAPRVSQDSVQEIVVEVLDDLVQGRHTVSWRTTGADGHPVQGEFAFVVQEGVTASGSATGAPTAAAEALPEAPPGGPMGFYVGVTSPLYVLTRWGTFAGMVGLFGALFLKWAVLPRASRTSAAILKRRGALSSRAAGLGRASAFLLLVVTPSRLVLQGASVTGDLSTVNAEVLWLLATDGIWGVGWLVQAVGVVLVLAGLGATRGKNAGTGWALASLGAAGLALSPALSGHAAGASATPWLAIGADALHIVGAGGWLGGLLAVFVVGVPVVRGLEPLARGEMMRALVFAFSPLALACAGLVVLTGALAATEYVGTLEALTGTAYGRTLLLKLGLVAVVWATGAYNFLRVKPALGAEEGERRLVRSGFLELGAGLLVLLVTAILVAVALPR